MYRFLSLSLFNSSKYATQVYVAHLDFPEEDSCFMVTTSSIIKIRSTKLRVLWEVSLGIMVSVSPNVQGVGVPGF